MRRLNKIWFALREMAGRGRFEREMRDEMDQFVAMDAQQKEKQGLSAEEAQRMARVQMHGVEQTKERVRALRPGVWLETLMQDLGFAARMLRKHPGYLTVAVVTMALGIGANTAIFSVVYAVLLRPLPFRDADRLMFVQTDRVGEARASQVAYLDYTDVRAQHSGVEDGTAIFMDSFITSSKPGADGQPVRRQGLHVTPSFFSTLGVQPALGRAFLPDEEEEGKDRVAILSHGAWREIYGGRNEAIGESIVLDGVPHVIIGVMPVGFDLMVFESKDVFVPLTSTHRFAQRRAVFAMYVIARLKAGVTQERAQSELTQVAAGLAEKYRDTNAGRSLALTPVREQAVGAARPLLLLLAAAVGAVLLAACVNLANLMIGRLASREQELAVRAALGASRMRLARQLLAESLLLVTLGGAAGVLLAWRLLPVIAAMITGRVPGAESISLNGVVLTFALLLTVMAGAASGLLPARTLWSNARKENLHGTGRSSAGASRSRMRKGLVVAEIAISCVLLVGAGLLGSSLLALLRTSPGFDAAQLLTFQVTLSPSRYETRAQIARALTDITQRIRQLPGVVSATATGSLPLTGHSTSSSIWIEGRMPAVGQQPPDVRWQYVQQGYFEAMRMPLLRGRHLEERDIERKPHVTLISEAVARRDFPGENPIGKRVSYGPPQAQPDWHEIIGVVGDIRHGSLREEAAPRVYDLFGQHAGYSVFIAVRTDRNAAAVMPGVRTIVREIDAGAPVDTVRTMDEWIERSVSPEHTLATLVGVFALAALFLGAVGAYGVIASLVEQRTREIGIRMALGASPGTILRATVGEGVQLAVIGLTAGLALSLALTPLLRGMLFGVGAADPRTFAAVSAVLLIVALAACYIPARRAARIDPIRALRQE